MQLQQTILTCSNTRKDGMVYFTITSYLRTTFWYFFQQLLKICRKEKIRFSLNPFTYKYVINWITSSGLHFINLCSRRFSRNPQITEYVESNHFNNNPVDLLSSYVTLCDVYSRLKIRRIFSWPTVFRNWSSSSLQSMLIFIHPGEKEVSIFYVCIDMIILHN